MNAQVKEIENKTMEKANSYNLMVNSTLVMGVVNITPDSFYDGGKYNSTEGAIERAEILIAEGADIIDLGAASTRPGAEDIGPDEELKRLLPVLDYLLNHHKVPVSIDTFHSSVA